jgi:hypothetical protein
VKEVTEMDKSKGTKICKHPERLKGKPGECSPEQIRECHGAVVEHPCEKKVTQPADLDTKLQAIIKPCGSCVLSTRLLQSRKQN